MFDCPQLEKIRLSKNRFEGTISPFIGRLVNLREIQIGENQISGTLPQELFECWMIESIIFNKNNIGGSIPTEVGNLPNVKTIILDHNRFKGTIPIQLENLTELNIIKLDHNLLTGVAPRIERRLSYTTDCGEPNTALSNPLSCDTCDRCCNSNGNCKDVVDRFYIPVYSFSFAIAILALMTSISVVYFLKVIGYNLKKDKDLHLLYVKESTNSFIFSQKTSARVIYSLTIIFQTLLFIIYLLESERSSYTLNIPLVQGYAWVSFSLVILCFLGADLVMSLSQLREGFLLNDNTLCVSGTVLFLITIVAMTTSFFYCSVSVENNTQLIVDAVVLLFIMDLDDRIFFICNKTAPNWTREVQKDVEINYKTRFRNLLTRQNGTINLGSIA